MEQPLIAPAWRRAAVAVALLGLGVFLSLAVLTFHAKRTAFDSWAFRVLPEHIAPAHAQVLIGFTEPAISVLLLALTVVLAVSVRRPDLAVLAVVGPILGTVLASDVAKPIVHRTLLGGTVGSYPSGHETGVTCTATVLLIAFGRLPLRRAAKSALAAVLAVWVIVAAVGLTRFYYHYATDTIGAMGLSVALVLGLAALLDRYWPAHRGSGGRGSGRRAPGQRRTGQRRTGRRDTGRRAVERTQSVRTKPAAERPARPRPGRRPRPVVDETEAQLTPRA